VKSEPTNDPNLFVDTRGITARGQHVDSRAPGALQQLSDLLGPEIQTTVAGVNGSGRTAHWLQSGVVLVNEDATPGALLSLYVCFDEDDSSPYPDRVSRVARFRGSLHVDGHVFSGGEPEASLLRIPRMEGFAGMLVLRYDGLRVGFALRKPRAPTGKRIGSRRLVQIVADWSPLRGFSRKASSDEMWAE